MQPFDLRPGSSGCRSKTCRLGGRKRGAGVQPCSAQSELRGRPFSSLANGLLWDGREPGDHWCCAPAASVAAFPRCDLCASRAHPLRGIVRARYLPHVPVCCAVETGGPPMLLIFDVHSRFLTCPGKAPSPCWHLLRAATRIESDRSPGYSDTAWRGADTVRPACLSASSGLSIDRVPLPWRTGHEQ
jgi:hypothetical protein